MSLYKSAPKLAPSPPSRCQGCGCHCNTCSQNKGPPHASQGDHVAVHLYQEIEHLKRQLAERDYHIVQMETAVMNHARDYPDGEWEALQETLRFWQEKYERLLESHRKLQKVNQALEDKLLRVVDKFESEKSALTRDVAELTTKLVEARVLVTELEDENEAYKNDCNIAVHLLQCKPSNFVSHKVNTLPSDLQEKVRHHLGTASNHRRSKSSPNGFAANGNCEPPSGAKVIRVPISTFPPTAMVYSVTPKIPENSICNSNGSTNGSDYVSAAIMAKVLEERSKERHLRNGSRVQKCSQCRCRRASVPYFDQTSQTPNGILTAEDYLNHYPWGYWSEAQRKERNRTRTESSSSSSMESISITSTPPCNAFSQTPTQQHNQQQQSQYWYHSHPHSQHGNNGHPVSDQINRTQSTGKRSNETIII